MTKKSTSNRNLLGAVGGMGGGKSGGRMNGILNDWDMLLPSGDPYEDVDEDEDDDGMNENERWKKKQLTRRGWESRRGQGIILGLIISIAVFVRIWKLAIPAAVVYVSHLSYLF
jgi:dolichyl-phosphate-mannose-protein mannosyltransferase